MQEEIRCYSPISSDNTANPFWSPLKILLCCLQTTWKNGACSKAKKISKKDPCLSQVIIKRLSSSKTTKTFKTEVYRHLLHPSVKLTTSATILCSSGMGKWSTNVQTFVYQVHTID